MVYIVDGPALGQAICEDQQREERLQATGPKTGIEKGFRERSSGGCAPPKGAAKTAGGRIKCRSHCLKAQAEGVCPTRPDLILQAGSAAQIGAGPCAVADRPDTLTLHRN